MQITQKLTSAKLRERSVTPPEACLYFSLVSASESCAALKRNNARKLKIQTKSM
jgi:hypothetical protein